MRRIYMVSLVCFLVEATLLTSCLGKSSSSATTESVSTDKFALWQKSSFFRGAVIQPYQPFGAEEGRTFMGQADFQSLRDTGANVVSLNYPGPYQVEAPYGIDSTALQYLDDAVTWARESGLYVILHFRNGPGKSEDTFGSGETRVDETLWYSTEAQDKWVEMWKFVAERYASDSAVIGYNLMVEPHPDLPVSQDPLPASVWNELARRITTGIREVDTETPIIVSSITYANPVSFPELEPTGDSRTIYSFHMYEPFQFTHQGLDWAGTGDVSGLVYPGLIPSDLYEGTRYWEKSLLTEFLSTVTSFQAAHGTPILVGEFGCYRKVASCVNYFTDLLSIFEEKGWHYSFFCWKDSGDFDYERDPSTDLRRSDTELMRLFREHFAGNQ